ncbi:hypothetical protein KM043_001004 [Ampulex compressa]|nr:hypothetical protein KM043_001004 [Ampulex compressa]
MPRRFLVFSVGSRHPFQTKEDETCSRGAFFVNRSKLIHDYGLDKAPILAVIEAGPACFLAADLPILGSMTVSASIERMEETIDRPGKKLVNANLLSLKLLLFLFFGGIGCLFPFLPLHMKRVGLSMEEIRRISIVSPAVAALGPLVVAPIADRLAGSRDGTNSRLKSGRHLRSLIAIACLLSAIFHSLLLLLTPAQPLERGPLERTPRRFYCDRAAGAFVERSSCPALEGKDGQPSTFCPLPSTADDASLETLVLRDCRYVAYTNADTYAGEVSTPYESTPPDLPGIDELAGSGYYSGLIPLESGAIKERTESELVGGSVEAETEPPHVCFKNASNQVLCHVYTGHSGGLTVNVSLGQPRTAAEAEGRCVYPVMEALPCRVPSALEARIECALPESPMAHGLEGTVLANTHCEGVAASTERSSFWWYLGIRSTADLFLTTAVALVDAAVVIATGETSRGRGEVGRQLSFGSLGLAVFGPLCGYATTLLSPSARYYPPILLHALLLLLAGLLALCAHGMPLGPPEWWWHTRSGMLALPMSAVKRYGCETASLVFLLILMGTFWSAMDTYLPFHLQALNADELAIGTTMTVGALPAILFLWRFEHLVDYCGHGHLLIAAFVVYIVRFVGLYAAPGPWWSLLSEGLEVFSLEIMWVTAVLYLRHLVPRNLTMTAQALPVVAHFCIGRCIGAIVGSYDLGLEVSNVLFLESLRAVYYNMAIAAAIVATLCFICYHRLLKPQCHAHTVDGSRKPATVVQAINGNGSYTPLKIYHNGMAKKGQFRY